VYNDAAKLINKPCKKMIDSHAINLEIIKITAIDI
jgi:hypothetical protein